MSTLWWPISSGHSMVRKAEKVANCTGHFEMSTMSIVIFNALLLVEIQVKEDSSHFLQWHSQFYGALHDAKSALFGCFGSTMESTLWKVNHRTGASVGGLLQKFSAWYHLKARSRSSRSVPSWCSSHFPSQAFWVIFLCAGMWLPVHKHW